MNLRHIKNIPAFYNPPEARGEDTFFSMGIGDLKVIKVPEYHFHDGFLKYREIMDGDFPQKLKLVKAILKFYVWIIRGTPLLLQLIFIFYGLPTVGIVFPRYEAALVAFIINYAAYFAEIFRGGLQAVPVGQFEAAQVLGLSRWQTINRIVRPQVVKIVLPSIGNELINLVKDSSLVYVIGLGDLLRAGNVATARDFSSPSISRVRIFGNDSSFNSFIKSSGEEKQCLEIKF